MLAGHLALTIAAVFTGAAIYVNVVSSRRVFSSTTDPSRRVGASLQARLHNAGEPRDHGRALRARCILEHPRLALAAWSRRPPANWPYDLRDHADQPPSHGHAAGGRHGESRRTERGAFFMPVEVLGLVATDLLWAQR